jgi:hypothetical protein
MLSDSTIRLGIAEPVISVKNGKNMNLTKRNSRMKSAIQLHTESEFHRKFQIFPRAVLGIFFWIMSLFFIS